MVLREFAPLSPPEAPDNVGAGPRPGWQVRTLGGFELTGRSGVVQLQPAAARLVALLAIRGGQQQRARVASTLWIDTTERQASANLRSLLWRFHQQHTDLLEVTATRVWIAETVDVDLHRSIGRSRTILRERHVPEAADVDLLAAELLPDWYDEWVVVERERDRQRRLHALEVLSSSFSRRGQHAFGLDAGLAAVAIEPLRESAHRVVIAAHLAEGNATEAVRHYEQYARLLAREMGLHPSPGLRGLLTGLIPAPHPARRIR